MKRFMPLLLALVPAASAVALPANVEKAETYAGVDRYRLKSNGMTLVVVPNHASPVFTFLVVYHVGSRNEAPGNTGSAHLLEHMIFNKSTENFGKAKGHPTFQEVLFEAGADYGTTNMTTWTDRMTGYSTLPADKLELAMKIEADRLSRGLILDSERQPEMSVVRNEYEIGENNPSQALDKAVIGAAIQAHPYHWSTIGYRSDIEGVSTETLRRHYKTYFWPDNAEAVLVGDVDTERALAIFDREFGGFAKSPAPIPPVVTVEPPQEGERRVVVKRPGKLTLVALAYIRPGALHPDYVPIDVLGVILGRGINARLHQALVETGLATSVDFSNEAFRDAYPLQFEATVAPGRSAAEVEEALKAVMAKVAKEGVTDEELKRAQQQLEVVVLRSRDGTYAFASNLGEAIASADWKWFFDYVPRVRAVTAADVQRVAAAYLLPDHATVGWFVPTPAGEAAKAAAALPAPTAVPSPEAMPASASAKASTFAARTTRKVLANGIVLDVVENHALPTVAVRGLVLAGESASLDHPALPRLVADMLPRGTAKRSKAQIAAALDAAGATRAYDATPFELTITANGRAKDLPLLVDVLSEELVRPAFASAELDKSRPEVRAAVLRLAESTTQRSLDRLTQLALPTGHPYRAAGSDAVVQDLDAATVDTLRTFHARRVVGASMVLAVVGDVKAAEVVRLVEKAFAALPKGERLRFDAANVPDAAGTPAKEVVRMPGKANMSIGLAAPSRLRRSSPDYEAALIANAALGQSSLASRLGKRVRDTEGLSYSLFTRFQMADLADGVFWVNVNVAPQNVAKALRSTREVLADYAKTGLTAQEVEIQKSFFAGNYQVGLGSNGGVASALVTAEKFGYGPSYLDEFPARMRKVTLAQANAALKAHLDPAALHLVIAGDLETLPE